ncbi:unnamed protein product [Mortierella alpina]
MQTNLPFWVIGLFFAAFKILLVRALGGLLSIYAASGNKYGNSIRWYRQGGYYEMASVLRNSFRHVPRPTIVAVIMAIIASMLALFSSAYFSTMVHRSDIESNRSYIGIKTKRLMPSGRNDQWTGYLPYGSKVEDVLGLMVNDTRNLAEAVPGRRYSPRKFSYKVTCQSIDVIVRRNESDLLPQAGGACSVILFSAGGPYLDWDPETAINVRTGPNEYTIVASVKFPEGMVHFEPSLPSFFLRQNLCVVHASIAGEISVRLFRGFPASGMTSLPRTAIYKCQYPSGALNVVAQTRMMFSVQSLAEYDHITTTIFEDSTQLPLLATMGTFTRNGTFSNPQVNSTLVALTKTGANVHFLRCHSVRSNTTTDIGLLCSYNFVESVMTAPQPEDPFIAADLIDRPVVAANLSVNQNAIWVDHLNMDLTSSLPTFSAPSILNATRSAAQYFASLGQNFVMDWEKQELYVLFDTVDIKDGQEFSTDLFAALVVAMVLCAGLWAYTETTLKAIHTGSLYKLVYTNLKPHMEKPIPMLMSCTPEPLAFEHTSLPFWVIGLFFKAFKILLAGALGGLLSIYAASGSEYGNSIRWSHQGGYLEMVSVLRNSFRHVPRSTTLSMIVAILASLMAHFSSVFLSTMVHRSDIESNQSSIGIKTKRLMPSGNGNDPWITYLGHGSKVEDALGLMINDTRNLADAVLPGKRYIPRTFSYEVACDSMNVALFQSTVDPILQDGGGCSVVIFNCGDSSSEWDPQKATTLRTAPDLHTFVTPLRFAFGISPLHEPRAESFLQHQYLCLVGPSMMAIDTRLFDTFPDSGMTSLPKTVLYKCQYPSGALNVVAQTQMSFAVQTLADFDAITTAIFDDTQPLPLLATMSAFTQNGTFLNSSANSTLVALFKTGATVHFLRCHSVPSAPSVQTTATTTVGLLCSYNVVEAVMTTPQPIDPTLAADLKDRPTVAANEPLNQNVVVVGHLPMRLTNDPLLLLPTFSVSSLLEATRSGAQYLASLGSNFVMDWQQQQLYVLFETADVTDGQEFSTALFIALCVVMVLCAGVWLYSAKCLKAVYTGSLYKVVYTELEPHMGKSAPMLMSCTHDPLAFVGVPIRSEEEEGGLTESRPKKDVASLAEKARLPPVKPRRFWKS